MLDIMQTYCTGCG